MSQSQPTFVFRRSPELDGQTTRHPVIVLGAGPVGLAAAVDLALHDISCVVIDSRSDVSEGSRAICWAKRSLEICDRLGTGDALVEKGVTWNEGEIFVGDELIYSFNLLPEPDHKRPAFINLQQFFFEQQMVARATELAAIDLRWQHSARDVRSFDDHVEIQVDTPDGPYTLEGDWLIACDGVRSQTRESLGLDFEGRVFQDRFLIADIRMKEDFPAIRRFWFSPTFFDGQSTLMHKQADDVWRIDFQLGWDADPDEERKAERVIPRIERMLGHGDFEIVWTSVYTFTCRRLARLRHGCVFFAGDSAHVVSPFGARGGNSGLQDTDNLAWKLASVIRGDAPERLLDSYDAERIPATDENLLNSTRSTDFMTPKSKVSGAFRDAVLDLARDHEFARRLVNSGRLSVPARYSDSPLNTPDADTFKDGPPPGAPAIDAPLQSNAGDWLIDHLADNAFTLVHFGTDAPSIDGLNLVLIDATGLASDRYDARPGTCYLFRPDQHVAARWRHFNADAVTEAWNRACARL
ncbi:MAG: FAD-dependent oxidoreductase [Alphaproteobacteria bacterium]|nr:FAD-dependent oxidoreductase [Alphaproteobacteria bacterium]